MKKLYLVSLSLILCVAMTSLAFCWGNATHTYLAAKLGAQRGQTNLNEMYGAVLPDAFNFVLDANGVFVADRLHNDPMTFVRASWGPEMKSVAYGFASHNQLWGADFTAHIQACTAPGAGWAILKGNQLAGSLQGAIEELLVAQSVDPGIAAMLAPEMAIVFGHDLVETAVDILVRRTEDPDVGNQMLLAAKCRPFQVPLILSAAYAPALSGYVHIPFRDAVKFIVGAESAYRDYCLQYGGIFTLGEEEELQTLSALDAQVASGFLNAYLPQFGDEHTVTVDPALVYQFIASALALVQEPPAYGPELAATMNQVNLELKKHHVSSSIPFAAFSKVGETDEASSIVPTNYSLGQNFPNPFNPSTTIQYTLAGVGGQRSEVSNVRLVVYDALGQEVATLVNERQEPGTYTVRWDANGHASGVYIYRLVAGNFTETKRMLLVR